MPTSRYCRHWMSMEFHTASGLLHKLHHWGKKTSPTCNTDPEVAVGLKTHNKGCKNSARERGRKKWKEQEAGELSQMLTKFLHCVYFGCSCKYVPLWLWRTTRVHSVEYSAFLAARLNNKKVLNWLKTLMKSLEFMAFCR
uniref:Uncharacterized protein n=1 Tax=Calidris pygmaea TaxID=425635 RepID=A0A8C3KNL6_9CHAR